ICSSQIEFNSNELSGIFVGTKQTLIRHALPPNLDDSTSESMGRVRAGESCTSRTRSAGREFAAAGRVQLGHQGCTRRGDSSGASVEGSGGRRVGKEKGKTELAGRYKKAMATDQFSVWTRPTPFLSYCHTQAIAIALAIAAFSSLSSSIALELLVPVWYSTRKHLCRRLALLRQRQRALQHRLLAVRRSGHSFPRGRFLHTSAGPEGLCFLEM
ncbi:hypothetical protein DFH07DRAFT_1012052, partial [Mycena maculata]